MDRKDLKIEALLQKVANLTRESENQLADFRVEITMLSQENEELRNQLAQSAQVVEEEPEIVIEESTDEAN